MQHFFRYTLDGDPHLNMKLIYSGLVIAIIIAYRFRKNDKLLKVLLATNVLLQIILFIWYLGYKELFIMEGLPLYLIAMSSLIIISRNEVKLNFRDVVLITFIMNLVIMIANTILGSNYSYLMKLPPALPIEVNKYIIFTIMTILLIIGEMLLDKISVAKTNKGVSDLSE